MSIQDKTKNILLSEANFVKNEKGDLVYTFEISNKLEEQSARTIEYYNQLIETSSMITDLVKKHNEELKNENKLLKLEIERIQNKINLYEKNTFIKE